MDETLKPKHPGGRPPGSPNKRTKMLVDILEAMNFDPVAELVNVYADARKEYARAADVYDAIQEARAAKNLPPLGFCDEGAKYLKIAQDSALGLIPYVFPKRGAITHGISDDPSGDKLGSTLAEVMRNVLLISDEKNSN